MSEKSAKAVAATEQSTVALATTSTSSASTTPKSVEAAEASTLTPTSSVKSSTSDGKQQTAASGPKRVIRTITVIDPRKLQQAGLDRKLAEAIGKQRLTATQTKSIIAKPAISKTQTSTGVAAVLKVATSTTPAAATATAVTTKATVTTTAPVTATATLLSGTAVTPRPGGHAAATKNATVVKPLLKDQKLVPKITITSPMDSSTHSVLQLPTQTERLAQVKHLLQRKILTKLQPGTASPLPTAKPQKPVASPSASPLPTAEPQMPATPSNSTKPGIRVIAIAKPFNLVTSTYQIPPPPLVAATTTSTAVRQVPKQPNQTNIEEAKKLPLDVARINKHAAANEKANSQQQPAPRTHVQSYENFLKNRLPGANKSRVEDNSAAEGSLDDDIPKASIKARVSLPSQNQSKTSATAVKLTALEFAQMSPLKQPYPIVSLSQDTPLPHISSFKKSPPVTQTPTIKTESSECNAQQPAMKQYVKSLIVLENKVLSQDEKIDITALRLAKPQLESTVTSSAQAFASAPTDVVVKEEEAEEFLQCKKEVSLPSHKLKLKQDVVAKKQPVKELKATSQPNVEEPQDALPLHKPTVPEDRAMKKANVEEQIVKPQNNAKKKVVLVPTHKLKLELKQTSQSTADRIEEIPANNAKEAKTVCLPSCKVKTVLDKLKTAQDKICNTEPARKLLPVKPQLIKEKKVFIFSPNKLKMSQNKIAAFAKEIKLQASTNSKKPNDTELKTPTPRDTQTEQQENSKKISESVAADNASKSPLAKLEFKEPLPPADKPLCAYSALFGPRQKSTVEIVEQPQQESILSAVDFIASLATTNPITEETELELSPEELNLNASFAMNLSPIRIPYPNEKPLRRESIDGNTKASEMLDDIFDSNADVEIGKIITIPADNVLNTVIAADKSGKVLTIASNKPLTIQSAAVDVEEAHEDHSYQQKGAKDNITVASIDGTVEEKSKQVVALEQKELDVSAQQTSEAQFDEINSNEAKQHLELSATENQESNADLKQQLKEVETERAVETNAAVKQTVVAAETNKIAEECASEARGDFSSSEKSISNNDDSAAKRQPRFRRGKVNLVQRKRTSAATTTPPNADRKTNETVDAADVSQALEEAAPSKLTVELQTAKPDTAPDAGPQLNADDVLKSQSLHRTSEEDVFDTNSSHSCVAAEIVEDTNIRSVAQTNEDEVLSKPTETEASEATRISRVAAEPVTDDAASNENATGAFEARAELVPNETVATTAETSRKQQHVSQMLNPPKLRRRKNSEKLETPEKQSDSTAAQSSAAPTPIDKTVSLIQPRNDESELVLTPAKNPFKSKALKQQIEKQSAIGIKTLLSHMELAKLDKVRDNSSQASSNETQAATETVSAQDETQVQPAAVSLSETDADTCERALVADEEKLQNLPKQTLKRRASTRLLSSAEDKLCAKEELELCAAASAPKKAKSVTEAAESPFDSVRLSAECSTSSLTEQPQSSSEASPTQNETQPVSDTAHAHVSPHSAPSESDQSSEHLLPTKRNCKRKRKVLDDRAQTETESEDDRDMWNNEEAAAFLGFDDQSPAKSKISNNPELLIPNASAEEGSYVDLNPTDKPNAQAVSGATMKSWLTTGKAIAPTSTKCREKEKPTTTPISRAASASRRSSVPLKKRWELLQNSPEQDIEITDDTSPIEDDEEVDKLHAAAAKRSLGERAAYLNIAAKKIKFSEASFEEDSAVDKTLDIVGSSDLLGDKKQNTESYRAVDTPVAADLPQHSESDLNEFSVEHGNAKLQPKCKRVERQETGKATSLPEPTLQTSLVHKSQSRRSDDTKLNEKIPAAGTKSKACGNSKSIIEYFEAHERRSAKSVVAANEKTTQQPDLVTDSDSKDNKNIKSETVAENKKPGRKLMSASVNLSAALKPTLPETAEKILPINKDGSETHNLSALVVEKKKPGRKAKSPAVAATVQSRAILSVRTDLMEDPESVSSDSVKKSRRKTSAECLATNEKRPIAEKAKSTTTRSSPMSSSTPVMSTDIQIKREKCEEISPVKLKKKPGRKPKSMSTPSAPEQKADCTSDTNPQRDFSPAVQEKKKPGRKPKLPPTVSNAEPKAVSASSPPVTPIVVEKKRPGRKPKLKPATPVQNASLDTSALSQSEMSAPVVEKKKPGRKPKLKSPCATPVQNPDSSTPPVGTSGSEPTVVVKKRPGRKSLLPESSASAPFNPRILLITNRSQLDTDEPLTEAPVKVAKPGTVQCGLCLARVVRGQWMQHLATHYGVGWIVGEMPEINLTQRNAVINVMVLFVKNSNIKELTCRMCGRQFRSALGALLHLEGCGAPEVRVTCEYCSKDYSHLTINSHRRTCAVRWESKIKDNEPTQNSETAITDEVLNNVGRVKRASVKKAEKRLKAIRHELVGAPTTMSIADAKSHIKLESPGGSDLDAKWNDDLQSMAVARCLAKNCNFECKDVPTMKSHYENCQCKTEVFYCALCSNGSMYSDEEAALKHIMQQHAANAGNDFDGDSTDCGIKTDQESSGEDDDGSSGVDSNASEIEIESNTGSGTTGSRKMKSKPRVTLFKPTRGQVYSNRSHRIAQDVANNWKQFVSANYSKCALFPYALPVYENCCLEDIKRYLPTQEPSMKFSFVQRLKLQKTFGCAERLPWTELDRFGTMNSKLDHLLHLGGPVKTLAWVPLPSDVNEQYLLLSYRRDFQSYTRFQNPKIGTTLLLLFKITITSHATAPIQSQLHYAVSIPDGPAHCTTFLPSGGYDVAMNRLGLLAVGTATNSIKVYALPLSVEEAANQSALQINVIELKPVIVLCLGLDSASLLGHTLTETQCVQICWSETLSHKHIFAGFSSGCVGIWDISDTGEEDNLNCFVVDGVRHFVPLNFFYLGEKGVRAMAVHYDTTGPRWLAAITGIRKLLCYDLRDFTQPVLLLDEGNKNALQSLDWSPLWEPLVITVGDSMFTYGRYLQAVHVNNLQARGHSKIDGTLCAASRLHYNPTISVLACTSDNGDLVFLNTRELNQCDVLPKSQKNARAVSSMDLKHLDGTALPKFDSKTQPPAGWQPVEPDYKHKYGLTFGPVIKCEAKDKTHYFNQERMPHVSMERYLRASSLRWNLNSSAGQLLAVGYDNGFVRLTIFKPQLYFKR